MRRVIGAARGLVLCAAASAVFLLGAPAPLQADVKILHSGKVKKVDTKKKKGGTGKVSRDRFHSDPSHPANQFEPGEVVVLNPPSGFVSAIAGLGYRISETTRLDSLGLAMYRLSLPRGRTVPEAVRELSGEFPGATIDANHSFANQAARMDARTAMGWKKASARCGARAVIGMIDSGVDTKHPALRGQAVKFRSFHRKGRRPGPKVHGTAVATMLVGKPKWGGLLPGARLLAASMFETKKGGKKVGTATGLLKSLNWLAKSRVHAINLSVAGAENKTLRLAFDKAQKRGLVMVAAAGNRGRSDRPA